MELSAEDQRLLKRNAGLRLPLELIPAPQAHKSLHNHLGYDEWHAIRHRVYRRSRNSCEICGERGGRHPVECHEVWSYDIETLIQKLERLQALCPKCHRVKHMPITNARKPFKDCLERFRRINKLRMPTARNIVAAARRQWIIRSAHEWKLDVSHISKYGLDPAAFKIDAKTLGQLRRDASRSSRKAMPANIRKLKALRRELVAHGKSLKRKKR